MAAETVVHDIAAKIGGLEFTLLRRGAQHRQTRPPAAAHAYIAAEMSEHRTGAHTVLIAVTAGKGTPAPQFAAHLQEGIGGASRLTCTASSPNCPPRNA